MNKHTDAVIEDWEKNAVGKNVHSVYVFCFECRTDGINFPLERKCGNCGSMETTTYYDRETIGILIQQARLDAAREAREKIDVWVKNMLFEHDGDEQEYKSWIRRWNEFLYSLIEDPVRKEKPSPSEEGCGCHPEAIACNCNNCLHCEKGEGK